MLKSIGIREKFDSFAETWQQKIIATVNDFAVKAAKLDGEFIWHHHDEEDEIFYVIRGHIDMHYRADGRDLVEPIREGQLLKVPRGVEHKPVAAPGTEILLIERTETPNTGNVTASERSRTAQPF
jgi:mannose-6-phosphate isomerase-like protein (cupin superfamily)